MVNSTEGTKLASTFLVVKLFLVQRCFMFIWQEKRFQIQILKKES